MSIEAPRASRSVPAAYLIARIGHIAAGRMACTGGCMLGAVRGRRRALHALWCAAFGVAALALILFVVGVPGIQAPPAVATLCPIVGLPGILRPDGRSFFRRLLKRRTEESAEEDGTDQGLPRPDLSPDPLPGKEVRTNGETGVEEGLGTGPGLLLVIDDPVSPGEDAEDSFPGGLDEAVEEAPDDFVWFDDPEAPDETESFPDPSPDYVPDDPHAPRSESLTDEELMRMLGLDDDDPSPGAPGYAAPSVEDEPAVADALPDRDRPVESLIDDLGSPDARVRGRAGRAVTERGADAVAPLIEALARADDRRRWCVAEALALVGENAIPALIAALGDGAVQTRAAATLVRIGEPAVLPLITALADDDEVQFGARYALREIGDAAVPHLVEALVAPQGDIRRSAASILRELGWEPSDEAGAIRYHIAEEAWLDVADYGTAAVDPLIRILTSPDREAWWNAARTLGEVGEAAVGPLVDLLHEADDEVRPLVSMALAEIGLPAVDPLIGLLIDPSLRETAATALVKIGEPAAEGCVRALDEADEGVQETLGRVINALGEAAIPPLILGLTSGRSRVPVAGILDEMGWEPWNDAERAWYLIAREEWMELALMGEPAVDPLIRTLSGDDDHIRGEAAATLGEIGLPKAVGPLVDALADDAVAPAAADALVTIGEPAVAPVLLLLERATGAARENAVEVLGRLGAHEAVPALVELVRSGGDRLHRKAVDALIGIGAPAADPLIPLLGEDGDGHTGAVIALTGIGDAALPPLLGALGDENARTRMGAGLVLKRLDRVPAGIEERIACLIALQRWLEVVELGAAAVDPLAARLGDADAGVQAGAAESLVLLGRPAVPPLVHLLGEGACPGLAADTLARIGEVAVEPLIHALGEETLRPAAAGVLVRIGRPAAGSLIQALGHPDVDEAAAEVLAAMGEPSFDLLIEALGNENARIRQRAGDVLIGSGDPVVTPLIEALGHPDDALRLEAIDTLTRIGRPAVANLAEALSDERYRVRLGAAEVLGRAGWAPETEDETVRYLIAKEQWASVREVGAGAVGPLIRTLNDPDTAIQMGAARALGMIGAPAVARLIDELRVEQDGVQRKAVEALKMIGEPAIAPLIDALQDRDWRIRLGTARALVTIGDAAVEPLVRALRDGPPAIQMGAAATLGKISNPAAIAPLTDVLLHGDGRVSRVVVRALGMMGEAAVEPLLSVLADGNDTAWKGAVAALVLIGEQAVRQLPGALTDEHFRVRAGVADALDRLGRLPAPGEETALYLIAKEQWSDLARMGDAAVEPLIRVLNDRDDGIRRRAAMVLGEVRDPRAVPGLMVLLHDDYYSIRREAAAALVAIGGPAVVPVISALGDPDADVRKRAADVLAGIGDTRAIEPLRGILDDEDWYVRRAAEDAVARIQECSGENA
ncbi:MAG: HEAT repeat domain-containing protein [Methanoculleus sp.]